LRTLWKESSTFQDDTREYFLNSKAFLTKSVEILNNVKTLPQEIHTLQGLTVDNASKQDALHGKILDGVSGILSQNAYNFGNQAAKTMIAMASLAANIKKLLRLYVESGIYLPILTTNRLATFSKEILREIAANT
jgi:hypothetical protein